MYHINPMLNKIFNMNIIKKLILKPVFYLANLLKKIVFENIKPYYMLKFIR